MNTKRMKGRKGGGKERGVEWMKRRNHGKEMSNRVTNMKERFERRMEKKKKWREKGNYEVKVGKAE